MAYISTADLVGSNKKKNANEANQWNLKAGGALAGSVANTVFPTTTSNNVSNTLNQYRSATSGTVKPLDVSKALSTAQKLSSNNRGTYYSPPYNTATDTTPRNTGSGSGSGGTGGGLGSGVVDYALNGYGTSAGDLYGQMITSYLDQERARAEAERVALQQAAEAERIAREQAAEEARIARERAAEQARQERLTAANQAKEERALAAQNAYDRGMNALNADYKTRQGNLRSNYNSTINELTSSYNNSSKNLTNDANRALQEAYINKMLNERNLGQQMAAQGLSGGASESTLASLLNNYGNARNKIENTRATNLANLETLLNQNKSGALQTLNNALSNLSSERSRYAMSLEDALANHNIANSADYSSAIQNIANMTADALLNNVNSDLSTRYANSDRYYDALTNAASNASGILSDANSNYANLLGSYLKNIQNYSYTPAEALNTVRAVAMTQANPTASTNYQNYMNLLNNGGYTNSSSQSLNDIVNTASNAALLQQLLGQLA